MAASLDAMFRPHQVLEPSLHRVKKLEGATRSFVLHPAEHLATCQHNQREFP